MQLSSFATFQSLIGCYTLAQAAVIEKPFTLSTGAPSAPFNLTSAFDVNTSLSTLPRHPSLPFRYTVPNTNFDLVFTSFGAAVIETDVNSVFIDAISFAIDGMVDDGRRQIDRRQPLNWQSGTAELSLTLSRGMDYNSLATTLAGLHDVEMTYGMFATRFDIRIHGQYIGGGQIASRPPNTPTATYGSLPASNVSTIDAQSEVATARRDLTLPPSPYTMHVGNTPISVTFSSYREPLQADHILDCLVAAIFAAAGAIRDSGGDMLIGHSWVWKRAVRLSLYPNKDMSWRNMADAVKGMRHFVLAGEGAIDFKFEVDIDRVGWVGIGRMARVI